MPWVDNSRLAESCLETILSGIWNARLRAPRNELRGYLSLAPSRGRPGLRGPAYAARRDAGQPRQGQDMCSLGLQPVAKIGAKSFPKDSRILDSNVQRPFERNPARFRLVWLTAVFLWASTGFAAAQDNGKASGGSTKTRSAVFTQAQNNLGIDFRHRHFGTGEKFMPENMGPGLAILDVNADDRLDIFFVQGAPVAKAFSESKAQPADAGHRLYLQQADGTFRDHSRAAGVNRVGIGMGTCFGDIDRDGDLDIYVSQFGADLLFKNHGQGVFEEVASKIGLVKTGWSTGCTFFDADADGDLDLFVAAYVDFRLDNHRFCGNAAKKLRSYCHPDVYGSSPDSLFINDGRGSFREISLEAGIRPSAEAKGLGVLAADFNGDGHSDVFVANDSTMNQLYLGNGQGRFEESALLSGVGFNRSGGAEAGMGVEFGDLDGDGQAELYLTHLDQETNTLYRPLGDGLYADATEASGLAAPSLPWVGFGTSFLDYDLDGDLDIAVVNGHILDNIHLFSPDRTYRQPAQLLENTGGRFRELADALEGTQALVGRGLVAADLDADGDPDLVLTQNDGPAMVLTNQQAGGKWIKIRLKGTSSNAQGFGARLEAKVGKKTLVRFLRAASGYLSQGPPEILLGLGDSPRADSLTVHWPSGSTSSHGPVDSGSTQTLVEPKP